jgi:hypothetical protein
MCALTCALSLSFVQDHGARPGLPWALFKMGPDLSLRLALKAASLPVRATVRGPATRWSWFRLQHGNLRLRDLAVGAQPAGRRLGP